MATQQEREIQAQVDAAIAADKKVQSGPKPAATVSAAPSNPMLDKFKEFVTSGEILGPIGPAMVGGAKNIAKGSPGALAELGVDMGVGALAGGPVGAAVPLGAAAAFGLDEESRPAQRAGIAATAGQAVSKIPYVGKALPGLLAFGEQVAEGQELGTAAKNAALLAMPEAIVRGAKKLSQSEVLERQWKWLVGKFSPNDISKEVGVVLQNAPDNRFEVSTVEKLGNRTFVTAKNAIPGVAKRTIAFKPEELIEFSGVAEINPQAAAKMFKGDPFKFAAAMQTIADGPTRAKTQVSWFYDNVLKNAERIDPGDLNKAVDKFGKDGVELAFGKDFVNRLDDIETAMKFAPPTKSLQGEFLGEWQYSKRRVGFDIARSVIAGTALTGGTYAASATAGGIVTVALPVLMYLGAINPKTTKLLAMATKNKNILATRALFNEMAQAGLTIQETVDGNSEVVLPPTGQDKQFRDMVAPTPTAIPSLSR